MVRITGTGDDGKDYVVTVEPATATPPPDDPPPTTPPPDTTPLVFKARVVAPDGSSRPVDAVDPTPESNPAGAGFPGLRGPNQLIGYTRTGGTLITGTNRWGREIVLNREGIVTAIHANLTGGVAVPVEGGVLSGHGSADEWLASHVHVGDKLTFTDATDEDPGEPLPPSNAERVLMAWQFPVAWGGPSIQSIPKDLMAKITHMTLCVAQSAQGGTGKLTTPPDLTKANVDYLHSLGVKVGVTVGGSSDGGITVQNAAQAVEFSDAILRMPKVDFVDLDLESSRWAPAAMLQAVQRLGSEAEMTATVTSGVYGQLIAQWGGIARSLGDQLIAWVSMNYDYPEAGDARQTSVVLSKIQAMGGYVPSRKMVMAYMPRPNASYLNASPPGVIKAAHAAALLKAPDVGAAFWETKILAATNYSDLRDVIALT